MFFGGTIAGSMFIGLGDAGTQAQPQNGRGWEDVRMIRLGPSAYVAAGEESGATATVSGVRRYVGRNYLDLRHVRTAEHRS